MRWPSTLRPRRAGHRIASRARARPRATWPRPAAEARRNLDTAGLAVFRGLTEAMAGALQTWFRPLGRPKPGCHVVRSKEAGA
jgi:hypothetical protein